MAKQRATVKWLLSKAYNNKVPDNIREPFYKDHENQEHLKPQLVHSFANAELYCLALANIYTDPNYHNLNHWGILRALNNKGIFPDKRLTETVLIQTNPLKLSAHLSVMEAIMSLYAKEVATPERVVAAVERFSPNEESFTLPGDHEAALVLWINQAVTALNLRINQQSNSEGDRRVLKSIKDLHELSDGVGLAALVSFYCPEDLPHSQIVISKVPTVSDCVKNLMLVYNFCVKCLPHPIFHMMPEDVRFMRGSMRSNLVVFLADLFNLLEIHPAQCVRFDRAAVPLTEAFPPRNKHGVAHKRCFPQPVSGIPDLRSNLDNNSSFSVQPLASSSPSISKRHSNALSETNGDESSFVVHRGKSIPTLSSMFQNNNSTTSTSGDNVPAGKPSNWEDNRGKTYYAGRRSRRNSLSDESQLTVENFGGSQENLHFLGRNPDKQVAIHVASKEPNNTQSPRVIAQENRNSTSVHNVLIEAQSDEPIVIAQENRNSTSVHNVLIEAQSDEPIDTSRYTTSRSNSISQQQYTPSSRGTTRAAADNVSSAGLQNLLYDSPSPPSPSITVEPTKRMSTFATLPGATNNTTTWQQQSTGSSESQMNNRNAEEGGGGGGVDTSQLMNIRLELEEKRRQIENEKRRAEAVMSRQRQKMGKAAFFQAVSKGKGSLNSSPSTSSLKTPDSDPGARESNSKEDTEEPTKSQQDISEVEQKWSENGGPHVDNRKSNNNTPETLIDQYQHSIAQIQEMQNDIQRLTQQQNTYHHHQPQPPSHQQPVTLHSFATSAAAQQPITMNYYQSPQPVYQPVLSCDIVHQPQIQWNPMYQGSPLPISYTPSPPPPAHMIPQHVVHGGASPSDIATNQNYFDQQHEAVDRLIRSSDPNQVHGGESGERFYLHDQNQQTSRKNWSAPPVHFNNSHIHNSEQDSRNVWNTRTDTKVSHSTSNSNNSNNFATQNGNSNGNNNRDHGAPTPPPRRSSQVTHAPIPVPPVDDMEPQSISFIGENHYIASNVPPVDDMEPQSISFIGENHYIASNVPPVDDMEPQSISFIGENHYIASNVPPVDDMEPQSISFIGENQRSNDSLGFVDLYSDAFK
ncbi:hypothetical protein M8J77_018510 [Diaphorina citri]|nr:hypothetical protein M8J77_018510 [Diaphorina citri]KAI5743465.1 hypothetical protein M8J77_018510 [Diaphorina citri]KAI5743466.1 hypothetical protein M8J77_018510 [Diaphorina citri]